MSVRKYQSSTPLISLDLSDPETEESATESGDSAPVDFPFVNGTLGTGGRSGSVHHLFYCDCCPGSLLLLHDRARMLFPKSEEGTPSVHPHPPCRCHQSCPDEGAHRRKAVYRLLAAGAISLFVIVGEVIGGSFANSLAIMTDAAHKLSDFATVCISLLSLWLSTRHPNKRLLFGWHRAEVLGALFTMLLIWIVTGALMYEAIERIIEGHQDINADIVLITACVGVFANVVLCTVLRQHGHGHSHLLPKAREPLVESVRMTKEKLVTESHNGVDPVVTEVEEVKISGLDNVPEARVRFRGKARDTRNINVRAAFVHSIGDLFKSLGVVLAGYIIKFKPEWSIADPICTLIFSLMVFASTVTVLRDTILVVMEGVPLHVNSALVRRDLMKLEGVCGIHDFFVWSLTTSKLACAAHLVIEPGTERISRDELLCKASSLLKNRHQFMVTVLQIEEQEAEAPRSCPQCKCQYMAFKDVS